MHVCCTLEEDLIRLKRVIKIWISVRTLTDFDYSYLLCTIDLVVELSKLVVVLYPPPYYCAKKDLLLLSRYCM